MHTQTRTDLAQELKACETQEEARNVFCLYLVHTYPDIEGSGLYGSYFEYLDDMEDTIREMKERYRQDNFDGENPFQ